MAALTKQTACKTAAILAAGQKVESTGGFAKAPRAEKRKAGAEDPKAKRHKVNPILDSSDEDEDEVRGSDGEGLDLDGLGLLNALATARDKDKDKAPAPAPSLIEDSGEDEDKGGTRTCYVLEFPGPLSPELERLTDGKHPGIGGFPGLYSFNYSYYYVCRKTAHENLQHLLSHGVTLQDSNNGTPDEIEIPY